MNFSEKLTEIRNQFFKDKLPGIEMCLPQEIGR